MHRKSFDSASIVYIFLLIDMKSIIDKVDVHRYVVLLVLETH